MSKARDLANFGDDISDGVISAERIPVTPSGTHEFVASGALDTGDLVVVNADGTVSTVYPSTTLSGAVVPFNSGNVYYPVVVYHEAAQKIVIVYQDQTNSNRGTAVVGTISGSSITFGTKTVFETGNTQLIGATYDKLNEKVVIAYRDDQNNYYGTAVVGTVSGTSISFGTPVVFQSSQTDYATPTYDENAQKVVIFYSDSVYGASRGIVGTVSGTSISFGSSYLFPSTVLGGSYGATYDKSAQRTVVAIQYGSVGYAYVVEVSGTGLIFSQPQKFNSSTVQYVNAKYVDSIERVVITCRDGTFSGFGSAILGNVISGSAMTFGEPVVFSDLAITNHSLSVNPSNGSIVVISSGRVFSGIAARDFIGFNTPESGQGGTLMSAGYSALDDKFVFAYSSNNCVVLDYAASNLRTGNFVGFSKDTYSDGATATIQIAGSVTDTQSGLSAGGKYFVKSNNTISQDADLLAEVVAGTAISSTSLIVKG